MSMVHIIKVGLTAGILAFISYFVAGFVAIGQSDPGKGLWVRTVLVLLSLFATAAIWTSRVDDAKNPELTVFTGLMAAWAINPQSWIGRSYAGQLQFDTGVPSGAADLVYWSLSAAAAVAVVAVLKNRARV